MLINENADRETSYTVWDYAEGQDLYQNAMLVDLTQPPDTVTHDMSVKISPPGKQAGWAVRSAAVCYFFTENNDSFQISYLYWTDLRQISRVGRTVAVDD